MQKSNTFYTILIIIIIVLMGYIIFFKNQLGSNESSIASTTPNYQGETSVIGQNDNQNNQVVGGVKTFVFDNFHGNPNVSLKFQFQYPASWYNEGQYFSPQKIDYYDQYSVKAPMYFDLI